MHDRWLRRAIALAVNNVQSGRGGPFGAVIAKGDAILAEGVNTVTPSNDPTAHAEVNAIREACRTLGQFDLRGYTLYASCEPCPMCLGAIYWARLDALYYAGTREDAAEAGFDDRLLYEEMPKADAERRLPTVKVALPDAREPFEAWMRSESKRPY
jgi:guanine deaminase